MVDLLTFVSQNADIILLVLSIVLAMVAKYFQNQATALRDAAQAVTDLSQAILDTTKDGIVTKEELTVLVQKIETAKTEIREVIDIFMPPQTPMQKLQSVFMGHKRGEISMLQTRVALMKKK